MGASVQINTVTTRVKDVPFGVAVSLTNASTAGVTSQKWEITAYSTDIYGAEPDPVNYSGWTLTGKIFSRTQTGSYPAVTFTPDISGNYIVRLTDTTNVDPLLWDIQTSVVRVRDQLTGGIIPAPGENDEADVNRGWALERNQDLRVQGRNLAYGSVMRVVNLTGSTIARGKVCKVLGFVDMHTVGGNAVPSGATVRRERLPSIQLGNSNDTDAVSATYAIVIEVAGIANNGTGYAVKHGAFEGVNPSSGAIDVNLSGFTVSSPCYLNTTGGIVSSPTGTNTVSVGICLTASSDGALYFDGGAGTGLVSSSRNLIAGAGLTGGGTLSADRTFNVGANADGSITVNADDIQVGILATDAQHGVRGGGTQHALATTSVAGFMSPTDKSSLANATFVVRSATNAPTAAQNLALLSDGILRHSVVGGLSTIARALSGTDYELPLTFNQGVRRSGNNVTADYITGAAGDQSWVASTTNGGNLTLFTSSGTVGDLTIRSNNVIITDNIHSALRINNTTSSQISIRAFGGSELHLGANDTDFIVIDTGGGATFTSLSGATVTLVSTNSNGRLLRAVAGTDYQPPLIPGTDYVQPSRTLTAGTGLTGGGDLSANRTFDVVANADGSIVANANDIQVGVINDTQHGNRGGGSLHALATTSVAGFMSAANTATLANATFVVRSSTNAPTGAQNIALLSNGLLKHSVSGGLSTIAQAVGGAGGDYEFPLVIGTGLTRVTNTVTANLSTGINASQSAIGGTGTGQNLTLISTSNSVKGLIKFGLSSYDDSTADTLNLLSANTTLTTPTFTLSSNSSVGQAVMHFRTNTTAVRAGIRADANNALYNFTSGGPIYFLTNGDAGTGTVKAKMFGNGNLCITGFGVGVDPSDLGAMLGVQGTSPQLTITSWQADPAVTAASSSLQWFGHIFGGVDMTLTTANNVTSSFGLNYAAFSGFTVSNTSVMSVTNAATVAIVSPPTFGGSITGITNNYSLRIFNGVTRMEDGLVIGGGQLASNLMLSAAGGHNGRDAILFAPGGSSYTTAVNHSQFLIAPFGTAVSDALSAALYSGVEIRPPTYTRAGGGGAPQAVIAATLTVSGDPVFSGTFTNQQRYAIYVPQGLVRFGGSSTIVDPQAIWEVPQFSGATGSSVSNFYIAMRVVGVARTLYLPLWDLSFG